MPSERSARVTQRRALRNRSVKRSLRTSRTKAARALAGGSAEEAQQAVRSTLRDMDVAARKGVIHANKAARTKSRLARKLNSATAEA
ncbi:MAG: 30S ribosomal protein S20 [Chloroflexota bacterium]|nr:30S ribosomal protein S20 [Chloroflexota bacterium]MDE2969750.1 30S ribosomal protein S20 [Chloroflexota bacterium]